MRPDMHKVIVERPRTVDRSERSSKERLDLESAPKVESMRRHRHDKSLNENLAPLRRFLHKNAGRSWNKVRSEMSKVLRLTSAVQAHVLQHVEDYVEEHPIMVDGAPHRVGYGGIHPLFNARRKMLYVCPRTGLLKFVKPLKAKKPKHPPPEAKRIDALTCAVKLKGCWHEATMRNVLAIGLDGKTMLYGINIHDAVLGLVYSTERLIGFYGTSKRGPAQYAAKLRPMTRDEIRRLPF